MNILQRNLLHQVVLKTEALKSVYQMQRLLIHRSHLQANGLLNSTKEQCICSMNSKQNSPPRLYSSEVSKPINPWLAKFAGFFQSNKSIISGKAVLVYAHGVDQVNHTEFLSKFQMPNAFNTWFLITEIHVWMMMVRAMGEREHGTLIRNNIVESMWSDALERSKAMAPDDTRLIKKQISELSGQFQYAIVSYDEGLTKNDKQLASALWKRFFNSNCDNYEHIELMVHYIRRNIAMLDKMSTDEFLTERNFVWSSFKEIDRNQL